MKTFIDLDALKNSTCGDLYLPVTIAVQARRGVQEVSIPDVRISEADRLRLAQWAMAESAKAAPTEPQISMADLEAEQKRDMEGRAAAQSRLLEYQKLGLLDIESNARQIQNWVLYNREGVWNWENVDAAVHGLGNSLQWKKVESAPSPQPSEPVEVLEDWQLPIDADEYAQRRASVKAVRDLLARRRKITGKYLRPSGSFGSSF